MLVVGLGNPGKRYERNRHNIGFLAVDAIAGKVCASPWGKRFKGEVCEGKLQVAGCRLQAGPSIKLFLLKPQTFMNLSGESVAAAAGFYKIPPENTIVLHDDLDLPAGKLRVKQGGGHGGHNGLKSLDAHIGKHYWRVRIGIGRPVSQMEVSDYVLGNFNPEETGIQNTIIAAIADHFALMLAGDAASFMNKIALEIR